MTIPDEEVAQVRAATDIVALIGEHAALRQQGRRWVGLCPFHSEKTPSFSVNAQEGFYYCFGCQASGDAITYVRAVEHVEFVDAVRFLADRAGIVLHETDEGTGERKHQAELFDAMARAVAWYHERLLSAPDAGRARDYLRSRGYGGETVRRFSLGWAPDDWDALSRSLGSAGVSQQALVGSGLAFVNRAGRLQDAFRARVLFPILDPSGRALAIGGRILPGPVGNGPAGNGTVGNGPAGTPAGPKYKNSAETAIYAKRRTLYALNWAKHDIVATGEVVVCEGYTDVIGCFTAGVPRAVATCGTALAEDHFRVLANFGRRIVLAYDADQAGQSAIARVYEWERRHEVDVRVAALPAGADPADLARTDPEGLRAAIAGAVPFLQFRVDRVLAGSDLSTPEGRARAADAALEIVAEHPDGLVRDPYVMRVAGHTSLDPELLRERLSETLRRGSARRPEAPGANGGRRGSGDDDRGASVLGGGPPLGGYRQPAGEPSHGPDRWGRGVTGAGAGGRTRDGRRAGAGRPGLEALRLAVHRPDLVVDRLEEALFTDDLQRRTFLALAAAADLQQAVAGATPDVADLLRRLSVEEPVLPEDPRTDPAGPVVAQLVREAVRQALAERQAAARLAGGDGPLTTQTRTIKHWLAELEDPEHGREVADRLVAWILGDRQEGR